MPKLCYLRGVIRHGRPVIGRPKLRAKAHLCVTAHVASAAFLHHTQWHAAGVYMHGSGKGVIFLYSYQALEPRTRSVQTPQTQEHKIKN